MPAAADSWSPAGVHGWGLAFISGKETAPESVTASRRHPGGASPRCSRLPAECINRQLAQLEEFADAAANRKSPTIVAGGLASAPITQCPDVVSITKLGPALHLPLPSSESVAVGNVIVGPKPQISLPEFAGDRWRIHIQV